MKNQNLIHLIALAAAAITLSSAALQAAEPKMGTLNVSILDENGAVVQDAPIYIYGEHKTHFVGGTEVPGTTTLTMPAGTYRVSSAIVRKTGDYLDRFASHEAHVEVVPGDNVTVILTLKPIDDPLNHIEYAELQRIGVPSAIAKSF